jgi:hypothetical protein
MQPAIYEEKIYSRVITAVIGSVTVIMFLLLIYQVLVAPIGSNPAPNLLLLGLGLLFLVITINFSRMIIRITPEFVSVKYGISRQKVSWENIQKCYLDKSSALAYGGSGIRIAKVEGKKRIVYSVVGGPRVVISLKKGTYDELAFSTRNPDEVIKVIEEWSKTK